MPSVLAPVATALAADTGLTVTIGRPRADDTALWIWPWQVAGQALGHGDVVELRFLVVPGGEDASGDLGLMRVMQAREALLARPVLLDGATPAQLSELAVPIDQLAALFLAGGVPLGPAVAFTWRRGSSAPTDRPPGTVPPRR